MTTQTITPVDPQILADFTRQLAEQRTGWDGPHRFLILRWDGKEVSVSVEAILDPSIPPPAYPQVMANVASRAMTGVHGNGLYAYALQIEAFGIAEPGPGASAAELAQFNADRLGRTFHKRADRIEVAETLCVDVYGRAWAATQRRDKPGIQQTTRTREQMGGQLVIGLLRVALITGHVLYGLPIDEEAPF